MCACGGVDVRDFGAGGGGDDSQAFDDAIAALGEAGILCCPAGTYRLSRDLKPDKPIIIQGAGPATILHFTVPGAGIRLRHKHEVPGGGGLGEAAQRSRLRDLLILCTPDRTLPEWSPGTIYSAGTRVRSRLNRISTPSTLAEDPLEREGWFLPWQEDAGIHFLCVRNGRSGEGPDYQPGWNTAPGAEIEDGGCLWRAEDWSAVTVSTSWCTIERCTINEATDCGVYVAGFLGPPLTVADGNVVRECVIVGGSGHGIFLNGSDAQGGTIQHNSIRNFDRGCGIYDSGFLSSLHLGNDVTSCRRSYMGDGGSAHTVWLANYFEDAAPFVVWKAVDRQPDPRRPGRLKAIPSPHLWLLGTPSAPAPQTTCLLFDGQVWRNDFVVRSVQGRDPADPRPPIEFTRWLGGDVLDAFRREGDFGVTADRFIDDDADDPGGYFSLRWQDDQREVARELTAERSLWGPSRMRFPQGFYLGKNTGGLHQTWITSFYRLPGPADFPWVRTRLWRAGDLVLNQTVGEDEPVGWRAARNGGWGGGPGYELRTWEPGAGPVRIGMGMEPRTAPANRHVYRLKEFQVRSDATAPWVRDDRFTATLSPTEPAWSPDGPVPETLDDLHRIVWEVWGLVGMTWFVLPRPEGVMTS
jgi:hypothetical protein